MDWHQFLREERKRKLSMIDMLESGRIGISVNYEDVSKERAAEAREHVAEIEAILTAAGEGFA